MEGMTRTSALRSAMRAGSLVRFRRPFEQVVVDGYVVSVGRELFLLAMVSDGIRFDGFQAYRTIDVRDLRPHPFAAFVESALRKRRESKPRKPNVSVGSVRALLLSAARGFSLVTIHRERQDADVCHIGRVVGAKAGKLSLLEIGPDAVWDAAPTQYALRQITRVDFGGDYEDALYVVGGEPAAG